MSTLVRHGILHMSARQKSLFVRLARGPSSQIYWLQRFVQNRPWLLQDIALMRWRYSTEFLQLFNMGYQNYSEGEWKACHEV
eukprot:5164725-Amphidinium_carterae.1